MIRIEKSQRLRIAGQSRLCADASIDNRRIQLWFSVDASYADCLTIGRADAFVMALLPTAMRSGHEIVCEDTLSERLYYQIVEQLAPALAEADGEKLYQPVRITAPLTAEKYPTKEAAGAVFSDGDDFLRTAYCHNGGEREYPLTHVMVFNTGAGNTGQCQTSFQDSCRKAAAFADEYNLKILSVDTNFEEVLSEHIEEVSTYRKLAGALALQGLLSVCLLSTDMGAADFCIDPRDCAGYDLLTVGCASTETLAVYLSGAEWGLEEKRRILENVSPCNSPPTECGEIRIGMPYVEEADGQVRLCAPVTLRGAETVLWFAVGMEYAPYLSEDRADAFAAALLTTAMREGKNIICEAPVSKRLLYQLNQYLIPVMASNTKAYHYIQIFAETTEKTTECIGAVGTGWTGGVDSLTTVTRNLREDNPAYKLTHLMIANNGAIEGENPSDTLRKMGEKAAKGVAHELGLNVVCIDSNLQTVLPEIFISVVPIRHGAAVLALQKLFKTFFISSTLAFSQFAIPEEKMEYYEPIVLGCLETENTCFYSAGAFLKRIQKLEWLSGVPLATRYLHPCIYALRDNCGKCGKCIRTQAALYAFGTLDRFSAVFDVAQFKRNKDLYFAEIMIMKECKNLHSAEILEKCQENKIDLSRARRQVLEVKWRKKKTYLCDLLKLKITAAHSK